jgi:hypothetical protein
MLKTGHASPPSRRARSTRRQQLGQLDEPVRYASQSDYPARWIGRVLRIALEELLWLAGTADRSFSST